MSTIVLVILGVLLAGLAAIMVIFWGGDAFGEGKIEAEAGRLVSEGAQIEAAVELHYRQEGGYPEGTDPVQSLIDADYLKDNPIGARMDNVEQWSIDYDEGMIKTNIGATDNEVNLEVCRTARRQLDLPNPDDILLCNGSDSPSGKLSSREPCCIKPN